LTISEQTIAIDTHTHSVLSGHAWSTIDENAREAAKIGLAGICITEHGPAMRGGIEWFALNSFPSLPETLHGVLLIPGVEYNILDKHGTLDITREAALKHVRFGIASMHDGIMPPTNMRDHTDGYIAALNNRYVHALGHPEYDYFSHDPEPIVLEAKKLGKLIEINNNSFSFRKSSIANIRVFVKLCKKHEVQICVSSDAHFYTKIGKVPQAMNLLNEESFPLELIINLTSDRFFNYIGQQQ